MDPVHRPPWTTRNFQKEIAPVNMKIYRRPGFEKHRLVSIAYVLEGLSRISGLIALGSINKRTSVRLYIACNTGVLLGYKQ